MAELFNMADYDDEFGKKDIYRWTISESHFYFFHSVIDEKKALVDYFEFLLFICLIYLL
jgi:hypothetical protein